MCGFMDILELLAADLCVNLSSRQQAVAEHLLDIADVRAVLQHQRRHGMPEDMRRSVLADFGSLDVTGHQLADRPGGKRLAVFS